jgi:hypothetical protein
VDDAAKGKQRLTPDHVAAGIVAGWTGCGNHGGKPWRAAHGLLPLVPGWLERPPLQTPDEPASGGQSP